MPRIDTWLPYAWQAAGLQLTASDGAEIIYIQLGEVGVWEDEVRGRRAGLVEFLSAGYKPVKAKRTWNLAACVRRTAVGARDRVLDA